MPMRRRMTAQFVIGSSGDVHAVPDDRARGGLDQAVDAAQQGGLARAAQADDRHELAIRDIQADLSSARKPFSYTLVKFSILSIAHLLTVGDIRNQSYGFMREDIRAGGANPPLRKSFEFEHVAPLWRPISYDGLC